MLQGLSGTSTGFRSGWLSVTSIGGEAVRAFVPIPLPPAPSLGLSRGRQRLLQRAIHADGRLDSIGTLLPDPQLFLSSLNHCFT